MQANALYYPHISLENPSLIKSMALFYDNIYRIVPDNVIPTDNEELQPLLEQGAIGRIIDPANYSKKASEEFIAGLDQWSAAALEGSDDINGFISRIHTSKIDQHVRDLFLDVGFKENNDWMYVPTEIASNFMLYMANDIATKNNFSLITSDWGAWTGTSYFGVNGKIDEYIVNIGDEEFDHGYEFGLFSLMLNEITPTNISEIPSEKIMEFREKRKCEIENFRKCMFDLKAELSQVEATSIRIDIINDKAKELIKAQQDYKSSADLLKVKGWFGVSMMGFPAPLIFGQLLSIPHSSSVILGSAGLALGGLFNISNTKEELKKLNEKHPSSFLIEFRNSFKNYTHRRGGGDMNFHAYNCMEEFVND